MKYEIQIADEIAAVLRQNGPLWSMRQEWCGQAFQQAHAIRAMLAAQRIQPKQVYLDQARIWADFTLRMQGTEGHPDRFNMGYFFKDQNNFGVRKGVPHYWYVADCGTIALALLDVATFLGKADPLRVRILAGVRRFADYIIAHWTLPDGSFALGYDNCKKLNQVPYHCANAQSNLFLWPLARMTGEHAYREQAVKTTRWLAGWTAYDSPYYGNAIHNRAYNGESLLVSWVHLPKEETALRKRVLQNIERHIIKWSVANHGVLWNRGLKHYHAKDPLLLMVLKFYQQRIKNTPALARVVKAGYQLDQEILRPAFRVIRKHGLSGMAIANHNQPAELFESILVPKFFTSDGLSGMAWAVCTKPESLYPLSLKIKEC